MAHQTDSSLDFLSDTAISHARTLITLADKKRRRSERLSRRSVARLFKDERAMKATITLTDEVMRIASSTAAARVLRSAAGDATVRGFGLINSLGIKFLALISFALPSLALKFVHLRVRLNSRGLILDSRPEKLNRHFAKRAEEGISLNINVLGEAVLGHEEADTRFRSILEMIRREEVRYVSVKISAIVAQLVTVDVAGSLQRTKERLRELYRAAEESKVFINLDMEEYRDLSLTVATFTSLLMEDEFVKLDAGIVIQAYLPESHDVLDYLIDWSKKRNAEFGSSIKIRIVKGANLAMEHTEAELHGWPAAPYRTKADTDASYLRLLDVALRPENSRAVRIGVASHNLFHLAWAIAVAEERNVVNQIDVEMLEGMANGEARALVKSGHRVLLYAPAALPEEFSAAVAYLVRRLDENTSPDNYLRAAFEISGKSNVFEDQAERFRRALSDRHQVSRKSLRHIALVSNENSAFANAPEADPTDSKFLKNITTAIRKFKSAEDWEIPVVVGGEEIDCKEKVEGTDPSDNQNVWYHYGVGDRRIVDLAVKTSIKAREDWEGLGAEIRADILRKAAIVIQENQEETIAVMARDAGKTIGEAIPEISEAIDFANYYAECAKDFGSSTPLGTVLVVPPWNFPFAIPMGGVCAALAAGNTVILKPSPDAVAVGYEVASNLWQAGVPRSVLQFLPMRDDEWGRYLVTHEGINGVILTGSFETAKLFTQWRPDIHLMAETSGKNAILITACADIDIAVKDLVQSGLGHAGQKCSAASLAIVESSIYEDPRFLSQLKDAVRSLQVGPGWELGSQVGPIIRSPEESLQRALTTLDDGESWLVTPEQLDSSGLLWSPGVKIGVKRGSWSHQNEWFGPVIAIMETPDFETGLAMQNESNFGLTAGIQSMSESECAAWIEGIQAGNIYVNRGITGAIVSRQPFGGWKRSSVGPTSKAGGPNYVNIFRNWPRVIDARSAKFGVDRWWETIGSKAIDQSGLKAERNFQRYRRFAKPILVFVDGTTSSAEREMIKHITEILKVDVEVAGEIDALNADYAKVRWLASSYPPTSELLERGISVDFRPIAQRGDIEAPRWLLEQSVSVTSHRYGNTNGGPKPKVKGL